MEIALWIVAINWGLPIVGFGLYFLFSWLVLKDFIFEGFYGPFLKFRLPNKLEDGDECPLCHTGTLDEDAGSLICKGECGNWFVKREMTPFHAKLWKDWGGVGLHVGMVYRDRTGSWDDAYVKRTIKHEGTHLFQQLLGLLFWVVYIGHVVLIFLYQKLKGKPYDKHPYYDCVWERQARRRAGQQVDLTPDQWPGGKEDLCPWW